MRITWISRNSYQWLTNGVDFAAFAVELGYDIFHEANWKMVGEFHIIFAKMGGFKLLLGGYMDFWVYS